MKKVGRYDNDISTNWFGTPDKIRTCDPQNRNLILYPAELRVLSIFLIITFA